VTNLSHQSFCTQKFAAKIFTKCKSANYNGGKYHSGTQQKIRDTNKPVYGTLGVSKRLSRQLFFAKSPLIINKGAALQ